MLKIVPINKFKFDNRINEYFYTTNYFIKTRELLLKTNHSTKRTIMQFIHFSDFVVMAGSNEIIALLQKCLSDEAKKRTNIYIASENEIVPKNKPLLLIEGLYIDFGWLENIIDGILCERINVATNTYLVKQQLLDHQQIIYMNDRISNYYNSSLISYPAYQQGIKLFVTNSQVELFQDDPEVKIVGTIPHALIQQYENNLTLMITDYKEHFKDVELYCLIDYENDVIKTLNQIKSVMHLLKGVRIDTSSKLIDKSLPNFWFNKGINPRIIKIVKKWLIKNNFADKKIIVSSQMNPYKIKKINKSIKFVDIFGIGSFFEQRNVHISADLVTLDGRFESKYGRKLLSDPKNMKKVNLL